MRTDWIRRKTAIRFILIAVILLSSLGIGVRYYQWQSDSATAFDQIRDQSALPPDQRQAVAPPRNGTTVVTTQWFRLGSSGSVFAIGPDGKIKYFNSSRDTYFDVDPVPGTQTIEVVAADHWSHTECNAETRCAFVTYERHNLTTGDVNVLGTWIAPHGPGNKRWHDIDRINDTHVAVAATGEDSVRILDLRTKVATYQWRVQSKYSTAVGGPYPEVWSHTNDVEVLPDGRIMASIRNMDEVVFLNASNSSGVDTTWTLGELNNHSRLHEQHNPDYLTEELGGPAVIVADSENDRVIEYQRDQGEWKQSWVWQDSKLSWVRDADRLPNGNTLMADSNGDRILEVSPNASVVWSVPIEKPYDVERIGTGPESAGGRSAAELGLTSRTVAAGGAERKGRFGSPLNKAKRWIRSLFPDRLVSAIEFIVPPWMWLEQLVMLVAAIGSFVTWILLELRWRYSVDIRSPILIE